MRINGTALYWLSVVLGGLTVVLVIVNFVLLTNNQTVQAQVAQRQQFINQSNQLSRVSEVLIRTLATEAANKNDDKVRDMLAQQGITFNTTPGQPPVVSGAPPADTVPPAATPPPAAAAPPAKKGP